MEKWHLIQNQQLLRKIFKKPPQLISYRKGQFLKDLSVRAKLWRTDNLLYEKVQESYVAIVVAKFKLGSLRCVKVWFHASLSPTPLSWRKLTKSPKITFSSIPPNSQHFISSLLPIFSPRFLPPPYFFGPFLPPPYYVPSPSVWYLNK